MSTPSILFASFACRICGGAYSGVGHTLSQGGVCCDGCNLKWVLPLRVRGLHLLVMSTRPLLGSMQASEKIPVEK